MIRGGWSGSDELQAGEVGGSDMLNPTTDTIAAPEIVDI